MSTRTLVTGLMIAMALLMGFVGGRLSVRDASLRVDTPEAMEAALREAFVEPDPLIRARDMERLMDRLDEENLSGAMVAFRDFSTRAGTLGVSDFFARSAKIDVERLVGELQAWPDEKSQAQGAGWIVYEYAYQDGIAKAITFYNGLSTRLQLSAGYRLVAGALNSGDESGLVEWVAAQEDAGDRSRLAQSIVLKLLREKDSAGAIEFFDGVPENSPNHFKRQIFMITLDKLVRHDVNAAMAFREARSGQEYATRSMSSFAAAWTDVDPSAALAWVEARLPSEERDQALETVVDRWATRDERSAIDWALTQPSSPMLDRLFRRFVRSSTIRDPGAAMKMARRISEEEMRRESLRSFARYWFNRKPDETRVWLVAGGLSDSEADALIGELAATRKKRLDPDADDPGQG